MNDRCEEIRERIEDSIGREQGADEKTALDLHCSTCKACAEYRERLIGDHLRLERFAERLSQSELRAEARSIAMLPAETPTGGRRQRFRGILAGSGWLIRVAAAAAVIEKDLVLEDVGTLTGTVTDANGAPVAGIEINTRILGGGRSWGGDHSTDDAGVFTIEGLRPGEYRVFAQRGWSDTLRKPGTTDDAKQGEKATVRAGQVATVKLVVEAQSGIIKGTVADTSGAPVGDAFVSAARESDAAGAQRTNVQDTRWSWQEKPVLTNLDGAFTLEVRNTCAPEKNTQLSGLYTSGGGFFTQCEAEGFRRITFFPARPRWCRCSATSRRAGRGRR